MCTCNPEIKTPFCGKPGCEWPPTPAPETPKPDAETAAIAASIWPTAAPAFNPWHRELARFIALVEASRGMWLVDSPLKYLELRVDTRSGQFVLKDRDGNRISPDRVVAAARAAETAGLNLAYGVER